MLYVAFCLATFFEAAGLYIVFRDLDWTKLTFLGKVLLVPSAVIGSALAVLGGWLGMALLLVPIAIVSNLLYNAGLDLEPLGHFLPGESSEEFTARFNQLHESIQQSIPEGGWLTRVVFWIMTLKWAPFFAWGS